MIFIYNVFFCMLLAYFVGSLPVGFWFAKLATGIDVTKNGSGNIGATNVARLTGKKWHFFLILTLDAFKAALALFLIQKFQNCCFGSFNYHPGLSSCHPGLDPGSMPFIASFLLIGNGFSPFLWFRGGKGVATFLGMLCALLPWSMTFVFVVGMIIFIAIFRRVAMASVLSAAILPGFYAVFYRFEWNTLALLIFSALWIAWRHWKNFHLARGGVEKRRK